MTREFNLKETFHTRSRRQEKTAAAFDSRSAGAAFARVRNGSKPSRKPETTLQRNLCMTAERKLKSLATAGLAQSASAIHRRRNEIRDLYAAAGAPAPKGSKLEQRIEKAARRAHYVSAEKKLSGFMAPDSMHNTAAHDTGTTRFFEAEVREHYAASGNIVTRGSRLDRQIETAAQRNSGYGLSAPVPG